MSIQLRACRCIPPLLLAAILLSGCATTAKFGHVAEDHTVRLISRPISAPAELAWRVRTFGGETINRLDIRFRRFPSLERSIPAELVTATNIVNLAVAAAIQRQAGQGVPGTVRFLVGGEEVFTLLEAHIANATNRIDIQTYIFDNDSYAIHFADLLRKRSTHGASVRVLLDIIGTRRAWDVTHPLAPPTPYGDQYNIIRHLRKNTNIQVRRSHNTWLSSDHVKFITIDRQYAFLGGMNIGWQYRHLWRDMMAILTGGIVQELENHFDAAWGRAGWFSDLALLRTRRKRQAAYERRTQDAEIFPLVTTPWRKQIYRAMLQSINAAEQRIYIENPYLWNKQILQALCAARHRGVDVRVVIPLETNIALARGADRKAANTLIKHKVRVFLYPGMTHKKATIIDNWAIWGSANFDDLSLHKNIELNLATENPGIVGELETILVQGQDTSHELLEPLPTRIWDNISSAITNLL
ncbi:MAG: phospholipase D-like domain-containing protein [Kiritimatiellia bacterium]